MRGEVEFPQRALEDFICVKGNGKPLFVLANAVDDRTMAITHVIRGEDQLPTTPRQIMLWGALNAAEGRDLALPAYADLPLLVNERGKKLSKRRDPVAVEMYREQGYLPAAFRNYLALLGWSPGDEEIVPIAQIIADFRLEDVQRSPAFFDVKKLSHINGAYIRALPVEEFVAAVRPWVDPLPGEWAPGGWRDPDTGAPAVEPPPWRPERFDAATFAALAAVIQERVAVLGEVPELVDFLFLADAPVDEDSCRRRSPATSWHPGSSTMHWRPTRGVRGTRTRSTRRRWPSPSRWAANSARPRRRSGWPSWGGPGGSRSSTHWRCSAARRRCADW